MDMPFEMNDDALETVTGGVTEPPSPTPTGTATYKCTACGHTITASTRDTTVTCPNVKCRCSYQVKKGKLYPVASAL